MASGQKNVKISSRLLFNVTGIEFIDKTPPTAKIRIKYCKIPTQFCILANRYKRLEVSIKLPEKLRPRDIRDQTHSNYFANLILERKLGQFCLHIYEKQSNSLTHNNICSL